MTALKLLFIIDPIDKLPPTKDTSLTLMREASRRGHDVYSCRVEDLFAVGEQPLTRARLVEVGPIEGPHHTWRAETADLDLRDLDAVFMRKDPPFNMDFIFATYILSLAEGKTHLINDPRGLRNCNEKTYILRFPELIPPSMVSKRIDILKAFVHEHQEVVLKPLDGKGGEGILLTREGDLNLNSMLELLTHNGQRFIMAQRFVPQSRQGDKRILLVDGEPIGAFLRVPPEDDLRGNMSAGASIAASALTERDRFVCDTLRPRLIADGHFFVGIDLLGDYMTEINVTSPTGLLELKALSGIDGAALFIDRLEARHKKTTTA